MSDTKRNFCSMLLEQLRKTEGMEIINGNPYYEKWGKGRPSKEAKERRKLAEEWDKNNPRMILRYKPRSV